MNKTYIKDLTRGDRFTMDGETVYVVDYRSTQGHMTRVDYHVKSEHARCEFTFSKVNLTTVEVLS